MRGSFLRRREEAWEGRIPASIRSLASYAPEPAGPGIRLDANETPWDVPRDLKAGIFRKLRETPWNRYPDSGAAALRHSLARLEGVEDDQVLAGNGSDEIIRDLILALAGPGKGVVVPSPTFSMYGALARIAGARVQEVPLNPDWSLDAAGLLKKLNSRQGRILFLATPNNPTGALTSKNVIREILRSTDRVVVVDEAYRWFHSPEAGLGTELGEFPNLVILNTFSKALSLAGLRLGYLLGSRSIIRLLNRVRLPYNVNALTQAAALHVLEQRPIFQARMARIAEERDRLAGELARWPEMLIFPSAANFLLVRVRRAGAVKRELARQGVAVRGFSSPAVLESCLRITVGTPRDNAALLRALDMVFKGRRKRG